MKLQKRPTEPIQYQLKEHEGKENEPTFTLKPLSVGKFDTAGNMHTNGQAISALRFCCVHGIKGWTNLEPEYNDATIADSVERMDTKTFSELGNKIYEISEVPEQEKN